MISPLWVYVRCEHCWGGITILSWLVLDIIYEINKKNSHRSGSIGFTLWFDVGFKTYTNNQDRSAMFYIIYLVLLISTETKLQLSLFLSVHFIVFISIT